MQTCDLPPPPTIDQLTRLSRAVCDEFKINSDTLKQGKRCDNTSRARFAFSWIAVRSLGAKWTLVAVYVSSTNSHTTVGFGLRRAEKLYDADGTFRAQIDRVKCAAGVNE